MNHTLEVSLLEKVDYRRSIQNSGGQNEFKMESALLYKQFLPLIHKLAPRGISIIYFPHHHSGDRSICFASLCQKVSSPNQIAVKYQPINRNV